MKRGTWVIRRRGLLPAALLASIIVAAPSALAQTPIAALAPPGSATLPLVGNQTFGGVLGMDFDVNIPLTLTSLAAFDSGQNGIAAGRTITVQLWARNNQGTADPSDDTAAPAGVLASDTFTQANAGTLNGVYRTKTLGSPLVLAAGSYTIAAYGYGSGEPLANSGEPVVPQPPAPVVNNSGGSLQFVGQSRFGTTLGLFPGSLDGGPAARYYAGNFLYNPPAFDGVLKIEVDRASGRINLINRTAAPVNILGYSITSPFGALKPGEWRPIAGTRDKAPFGNGTVDPDDAWTALTNPNSRNDLSEFELEGGNGATLASLQTVALDDGIAPGPWIRNPFESDVQFQYTLSSGDIVNGSVQFTGNSGNAYKFGDLNFDGTAFALNDFTTRMLPNLVSDPTLSPAEAYSLGDLDFDTDIDKDDFRIFKNGFLAGGGSLPALNAALGIVPEPTALGLAGLAAAWLMVRRRSARDASVVGRRCMILIVTLVACLASGRTDAQIIALRSATPLSGNQGFGGELGMDFTVNEFPIQITSLGIFDSGQDGILGAGTSIHVEIWSRNDNGTPGNPFDDSAGVPLGSSTFTPESSGALAAGTGNRFKAITPINLPTGSYTVVAGGFNGDDLLGNSGELPPVPAPQINTGGGVVKFVGQGRFGTIGEPGNFPPSVDAGPANRYNAGTFQFNVQVSPLVLEVSQTSGLMTIKNTGSDSFNIDFYQINSAQNSLKPTTWTSLQDQALAGWAEGGQSNVGQLVEANVTTSTILGPGATRTLGKGFNAALNFHDLQFTYVTSQGTTLSGLVNYVGVLAADFNENTVVNSADFTSWKGGFGLATGATHMNGDADGDLDVDGSDFLTWQRQFGGTSTAVAAGSAVPEPAALLLGLMSLALVPWRRARVGRSVSSRLASFASLALIAAGTLALAGSASASTNDRRYLFGDEPLEDAANAPPPKTVGSGPANVNPNTTLDSQGSLTGTFQDLLQNNGPVYVNVGTGPGARPGAGPTALGIQFDGLDDYLNGFRLGLPSTSKASTGGGGPLDYAGISNRGFQLWVKPSAAGNGVRQDVVMDTFQHGVSISPQGTWVMRYSNVDYDSGVAVNFDQWSQVMVVRPSGAAFGARMYLNGLGIAAAGGDYNTLDDFDLVVGSNVGNGDTILTGTSAFFRGVLDDLKMFVIGASPTVNYGAFNYATDNDYVVQQGLLTGVAGDVNQDNDLTPADATAFRNGWLNTRLVGGLPTGDYTTITSGDLNFDGRTNMVDAFLLHEAFETAGIAVSLFVPEPSGLALALVGVAAMVRQRAARRFAAGR